MNKMKNKEGSWAARLRVNVFVMELSEMEILSLGAPPRASQRHSSQS